MMDAMLVSTGMAVWTVLVHMVGLGSLLAVARFRSSRIDPHGSILRQALFILIIVLGLFVAHAVEIWSFALVYLALGAVSGWACGAGSSEKLSRVTVDWARAGVAASGAPKRAARAKMRGVIGGPPENAGATIAETREEFHRGRRPVFRAFLTPGKRLARWLGRGGFGMEICSCV